MNFIAIKMLIGDRAKYLGLVAGMAFAALLVTQQSSIFTGFVLRIGSWIRDTPTPDLWVMDEQTEFTEDNKPMLEKALLLVRGVPGVRWAVPLYKGYLKARLSDGTRLTIRLIGLDDATLIGGPPTIVEGSLAALRRDRAVLINADQADDLLALTRGPRKGQGMKIGDRLTLNETEVEVVGTYRATPEFFWEPVLYTTYSRALSIAPQERRMLAYVLVKLDGTTPVEEVKARIGELGYKALTGAEFEQTAMDYVLKKTGILVNFGMTILLGCIIGALVSGQTLYTFVMENLKYFGAIKAMGATNRMIVRMIFLQMLVAGGIGYCIGLGVAAASGMYFTSIGLAFEMPWQVPLFGAVAIFACCSMAALLGLRRVMRLEPAIVFKA